MRQVRITQMRSSIACKKSHKETLIALGLRKPHHSVIKTYNEAIAGMIKTVNYLVKVEEV